LMLLSIALAMSMFMFPCCSDNDPDWVARDYPQSDALDIDVEPCELSSVRSVISTLPSQSSSPSAIVTQYITYRLTDPKKGWEKVQGKTVKPKKGDRHSTAGSGTGTGTGTLQFTCTDDDHAP
jgi:hypothetical protein